MRKFVLVVSLCALAWAVNGWVPATRRAPGAADWCPGPFEKLERPIMEPAAAGLDDKNVYNLAVHRAEDGTFHMLYRGESKKEAKNDVTGRLFYAHSQDGRHFDRDGVPVLTGTEWYEKNGVEDPRVVQVEGTFYLTYSGYDGKIARLCLATSRDFKNWRKHGPMFPTFPAPPGARYAPDWTKSGAILPQRLSDGKYLMIFGDTDLWLARSDDLLHWTYRPEPIMRPRPDLRDCALIEPGPPLRLTDDGILLLYNSADRQNHYAMFAALLDPDDPSRVLHRTTEPLLEPTLDWEINGYVPHVVFGEALIPTPEGWLLYYGGADRCIGLARAPR